jgi:insertion element IS1 protein InsB
VSQRRLRPGKLSARVPLSGIAAAGETANRGHGPEWQRHSGYGPSAGHQQGHISELKKQTEIEPINRPFLDRLTDPARPIILARVEEAEADEMWSFVGKKAAPRWLWQALDHRTGTVLAYVFGRREDQAFLELKALLEPFGIRRFFTDGWGAYRRHLEPAEHEVGKRFTQQLERKHLTLRTRIKRLVRKTICFSKTIEMHDTVIGLFINRYKFGRAV